MSEQVRFKDVREGAIFRPASPTWSEKGKTYVKFYHGRWPLGHALDENQRPIQKASSTDGTLINPSPNDLVTVEQ